ncbi:MAG: hypothetical protein ISS66_05515 [Desulfobacteraceae bacterium]|nr:hypothetical protein [Desulfobacteraceae bacterium]
MNFLRWLFRKPNTKPKLRTSPQNIIPANQNQEVINETDGFTFRVDELQTDFKEFSRVGEFVNLWIPKIDYPDKVYIYHRSAGPEGRLGIIPPEYSGIVISHLKDGLDYYAEIIELTDKACKIKCRLITKEETEHREDMGREAEETIIKAKALEKTNNEEAVCLYRKAMGILREIDQQGEKNFIAWRKQRFPINRLSLVLERQKRYKECLEEIHAYEKLSDKIGLYAGEKERLEKRKEKIKKWLIDLDHPIHSI